MGNNWGNAPKVLGEEWLFVPNSGRSNGTELGPLKRASLLEGRGS
jgi:hypothetical protein